MPLHLRINDTFHVLSNRDYDDRFNLVLQLEPGWNPVTLDLDEIRRQPKLRQMDMSSIDNLSFFTYRQKTDNTFYFDDFELLE